MASALQLPSPYSPSEYVAHRPRRIDITTPPRRPSKFILTPSPLRHRQKDSALHVDPIEDIFASTPFHFSSKPSKPKLPFKTPEVSRNLLLSVKPFEDDGFFGDSPPHAISNQTPHRVPLHTLAANAVNRTSFTPSAPKRKSNLLSNTPQYNILTPLRIWHASDENGDSCKFASLAPLPAPCFTRTTADAEVGLKRNSESFRHMTIDEKSNDFNAGSDDELEVSTRRNLSAKAAEEVAESISPGGHVTKRRAKSRPVSLELYNSPFPATATGTFSRTHSRNNSRGSNKSGKAMTQPYKPEFDRVISSATLFFGPAINPPELTAKKTEDEVEADFFSTSADSSFTSAFPEPADTSFAFSVTDVDSPPRKASPREKIQTKFRKPRDSGVVLTDDEGDSMLFPVTNSPSKSSQMNWRFSSLSEPGSNSFSSTSTLFDDSFTTPGFGPSASSSWPDKVEELPQENVDDFIVRTLTAGTKDSAPSNKIPGTPQKRNKTAFLGAFAGGRPWASAAPSRIAKFPLFNERLERPQFGKSPNNKPRKSCPADLKFPSLHGNHQSQASISSVGSSSESDDSPVNSRVSARGRTYGDVGLGRPSSIQRKGLDGERVRMLSRRSSSGAFSVLSDASSEASTSTPTRGNERDRRLSMLPFRTQCTPSSKVQAPSRLNTPESRPTIEKKRSFKFDFRNVKAKASLLSFPSTPHHHSTKPGNIVISEANSSNRVSRNATWDEEWMLPENPHEQPGRFERDFVEVDDIGAGEFGKAIKVRYIHGNDNEVFAVKKSKRFEGSRHRKRLREEVDILQLLSSSAGPKPHPNVLGYIESWEQDETMYILTELCEYGNFAHFLSEYGHHFSRLDESRVWKILADLSNGLLFIHNVGVIHLDLKPANIFITASGRFKIGDFGMASVWPRRLAAYDSVDSRDTFEREGDKMYLAAEVLQGRYGKETDIFSFGMTMLETAANIVVPTQGELWHRLREEDFGPVGGLEECSETLVDLIKSMMRKDASHRPTIESIWQHPVVVRTRTKMELRMEELEKTGEGAFKASPLAGEAESFLGEILGDAGAIDMDWDSRY